MCNFRTINSLTLILIRSFVVKILLLPPFIGVGNMSSTLYGLEETYLK